MKDPFHRRPCALGGERVADAALEYASESKLITATASDFPRGPFAARSQQRDLFVFGLQLRRTLRATGLHHVQQPAKRRGARQIAKMPLDNPAVASISAQQTAMRVWAESSPTITKSRRYSDVELNPLSHFWRRSVLAPFV